MTKKTYSSPELQVYGPVEFITGTGGGGCIDLDGDGQGKQLAWSIDWRGKFPILFTEECTVEQYSA